MSWIPKKKFYTPGDAFSSELLWTIPKKAGAILSRINIDPSIPNKSNGIHWCMTTSGGVLVIYEVWEIDLKTPAVQTRLWWTLNSKGLPAKIACSDERAVDLKSNIMFFTGLERLVYGELHNLEKEWIKETGVRIPSYSEIMEKLDEDRRRAAAGDLPPFETEVVQPE